MNGAVTRFVYDGQDVLVDMDTAGVVLVRYTRGPRVDELVSARLNGASYYYLQDALGSVVRILDSARNVKNRYDYLAWGEIWSQSQGITNRYTYTGRERNPDARTMHYRARTYLPHLGRFAQEDPLGFVDGVNLYRYVSNDPCTSGDPYGTGPVAGLIVCTIMFGYFLDNINELRAAQAELDFLKSMPKAKTEQGRQAQQQAIREAERKVQEATAKLVRQGIEQFGFCLAAALVEPASYHGR